MDDSGKIISIITPSLNQGHFIEETIKSVVSQEGDFFIDYIIADGGSTDGSVEIIKRYADAASAKTLDTRCNGLDITWLSEKDDGQSDAINKGIRMAKGDVAAWINSDDYYLPGAFSRAMKIFSRNPDADFVTGDGLFVDENGGTIKEWLSRPYSLSVLTSYQHSLNRFGYHLMQQATFWRRSVHEKIGELDETFDYAMDAEFFIRAGVRGLKFVHVPVKLAAFRNIEGTKSLSSPTVFWPELLEIFRRHRGIACMPRFLAYYFYNEGLHNGYDLEHVEGRRKYILSRWEHLPAMEREALQAQSRRALDRACLLMAGDAYIKGETQLAKKLVNGVISRNPGMRLHPLVLAFWFKALLGRRLALLLERMKLRILHYYGFRYDYRYVFRKLQKILKGDL